MTTVSLGYQRSRTRLGYCQYLGLDFMMATWVYLGRMLDIGPGCLYFMGRFLFAGGLVDRGGFGFFHSLCRVSFLLYIFLVLDPHDWNLGCNCHNIQTLFDIAPTDNIIISAG
ncbi:hypothetical protein V8F20_002984 [Naviculisporaceae sp. PSN 640]